MLTATRTVLHRKGNWFVSPEDADRHTTVALDPELDADLGTPDEITVTIEAGDTLNP